MVGLPMNRWPNPSARPARGDQATNGLPHAHVAETEHEAIIPFAMHANAKIK